ncbi:MAG: DUF7288 family protein [archaeon]
MVSDERGQAHTLEGIAAALLVVSSIAFALQVTAVTPLTASTASQHIETQYERGSTGLLATAAEENQLRPTLLYWNESGATFHDASFEGYYIGAPPETAFGETLDAAYDQTGVAYNVRVTYANPDGTFSDRRLVHFGEPSDTAVTVRRTVVLYDSDRLRDADGNVTDQTLSEAQYFAPDAYDGHLYNVVDVEVTIWRM